MPQLEVPRTHNYDEFLEGTNSRWHAYRANAARTISDLTARVLRERSMVHPDGFLKLNIGPEQGLFDGQVRLHFWIPGKAATLQPHSHPWHLVSEALVGRYAEFQPDLKVDDTADLQHFRVYYPSNMDARSRVDKVSSETYSMSRGPLLETAEGNKHSMPAGALHMSSPNQLGSITLAVMSPRFADHADFYAPNMEPYSEKITDEDVEQVMEFVDSVRGQL